MGEADVFAHGHALVVGVGADLPMTVKDAEAIRGLLVDPARGAYPPGQVALVTGAQATRDGILGALGALATNVTSDPAATVLVYYSGHGGRIEKAGETPSYYLVPYGYDRARRAETAITGGEFGARIQELTGSRKLIVILDCCHAGGVVNLLAKDAEGEHFVKAPVPAELVARLAEGTGRVVIASSSPEEISLADDQQSIFTRCLLDALAGKAPHRSDGVVRILGVLTHLFESVPAATGDKQHPMVPQMMQLSDNFPLCMVPEGKLVKQLAGGAASRAMSLDAVLSDSTKRRVAARVQHLVGLIEFNDQKIAFLEDAERTASPSEKFNLRHEIRKLSLEHVAWENEVAAYRTCPPAT